MTDLGAALSLASLGVSGGLGAYVFRANPHRPANRAFFGLMMAFVWWDGFEAVARLMPATASAADLRLLLDGVWIGIAAVPSAVLHVALTYPEERPWLRLPWAKPLLYAPLAGWSAVIVLSNTLVAGVTENGFGPSALVGPAYPYLAVLYAAWLGVDAFVFGRAWHALRGSDRQPVQAIVLAGFLLGSAPGCVTDIFWPVLSPSRTPMGFASLETLVWSISLAIAAVRFGYLVIEPVTEPRVAPRPSHPLRAGMNYLVLEPGRSAGASAFRQIVTTTPGLAVTALPPPRLAARFGLERTPIVWVTASGAGERSVRPQGLEFELVHTVLKFLRENPGTAILLDDLDYLAAVNGFEAVARFLKRSANQASAAGGTLIATVGRGTFGADQVEVLSGCVDHVLEVDDVPAADGAPPDLVLAGPKDLPVELSDRGVMAGLVLTTEHPSKARARFGPSFEILWLVERPEGGEPCVRFTDLDTEGKRAILRYLEAHAPATVVLEGLDQVALFTDFQALLSFLKDVIDAASVRGGRAIASLSPRGLEADQVAMVARRFDVPIGPAVVRGFPLGGLARAAPGSRTATRGPSS